MFPFKTRDLLLVYSISFSFFFPFVYKINFLYLEILPYNLDVTYIVSISKDGLGN